MYIKIPDNNNRIPNCPKEERLSVVDWLIDNTILTTKQIAELCNVEEVVVHRIFNDEIKVPFVQKDPLRNNYINKELLDFLQNVKVLPAPQHEKIDDPLNYEYYSALLKEEIFSVKLVKTYFLSRGHNAWWGTWSSRYIKEKSVHLTLSGAEREAEWNRVQGRVFTITEIPTLCFYTKNNLIFVSGINSNEENPFESIFKKDFDSIKDFVDLLKWENQTHKYPQFVITSFDSMLYLKEVDLNEKYLKWRSESVGTDYLLNFHSSLKAVNMLYMKYVYKKLIDILKEENNI